MYIFIFKLFILGNGLVSCENRTREFNAKLYPSSLYQNFEYDLSNPDTIFNLPPELVEISGLSNFNNSSLLAVQDEKGWVYQISTSSGKIIRKIKFGKKGDYEGIEYVDSKVYVTNSNGTIYSFKWTEKSEIEAEVTKTSLKSSDNIEGLGSKKTKLLLTNKDGSKKNIYSFSTENNKLKSEPLATLTTKKIEEFIKQNKIHTVSKVKFKTSGIAVHPLTKETYLLAHGGKAIIVLNEELKIKSYVQLNPYLFKQPEGICFTSDGTLYISNEGTFGNGTILKYSLRK